MRAPATPPLQCPCGKVSRFIGAKGYICGDLVHDTFIAGPEAGVKLYVGEDRDTSIFFRAEYQLLFDAADEAEGALDDRRRLSLSTRMARRHSDTGGSGITRGSSGQA